MTDQSSEARAADWLAAVCLPVCTSESSDRSAASSSSAVRGAAPAFEWTAGNPPHEGCRLVGRRCKTRAARNGLYPVAAEAMQTETAAVRVEAGTARQAAAGREARFCSEVSVSGSRIEIPIRASRLLVLLR